MRQRRRGDDAGSATVWVLALAALLAVVAGGALGLAGLRVVRAATATAADLAALAAAGALPDPGRGCVEAARVAAAHGARLVSCVWDADAVSVSVERDLPGRWSVLGTVTVRSRAGPGGAP